MTETSDRPILAIDIGGTKIAVALVADGRVAQRSQVHTPRSGRGADIVEVIAAMAETLPMTALAGVATTGIVDDGHLTALNPSTLPIENGFPLVAALQTRLDRPLLAINDAQAAAWAEYKLGAGRGAERMAFVTISTGIGAGLVLDGRLQTGKRGLAGHVGHMVSNPSGPPCGCGRRGCIERLASGSAIAVIAGEMLGKMMTAPEVFALAAAGDQRGNGILDAAANALAVMLCDLVASLDLQRIVIGGGVGLAEGFIDRLDRAMETQPDIFRRPLMRAALGADAGLVGIADLAMAETFMQ